MSAPLPDTPQPRIPDDVIIRRAQELRPDLVAYEGRDGAHLYGCPQRALPGPCAIGYREDVAVCLTHGVALGREQGGMNG